MSFVRAASPIWFFSNLTGQPFDDTYWAFFLENTVPYIPQNVFQDPNGVSPWSNPIEYQPSSGLPNNLYFDPTVVYRIEVRQGPTQNDPLIYLIENFVPGVGELTTDNLFNNSENLITNPQFADIYFVSGDVISAAGTYSIAPGWQLVLVGSGSTTLTQIEIPGDGNVVGNPPYALDISNSGWTSAKLIQQFNNNGAIFSQGAVAMSILAFATGSTQNITLSYVPSNPPGSGQSFVNNFPVNTGAFQIVSGALGYPLNPLNDSMNTDEGPVAFVQAVITLPASGEVTISNVLFLGQSVPLPSAFNTSQIPLFPEISYERVVDHEFHVFKDSILNEPKNSILTGWNFGNNPWQFTSTNSANVATNKYTADQTIVIQQNYVANGTGNNVSVNQGSAANNFGFQVVAVTAHNNFGILQYIHPNTMKNLWGSVMSSMVTAFRSTSHATVVNFKMRLIYNSNLPNTLSQTDPIASWTEGGDPVAAAGYILIAPPLDPVYTLTSTSTQFSFNNIQLPTVNGLKTLGILVYTISNMNQAATADFVMFNDVSLVQNEFALPTQPETFDETLRKCQYYYEKSLDWNIVAGSASSHTSNSSFTFSQNAYISGGSSIFSPNGFTVSFKTPKCQSPTMTIYSPNDGSSGQVYATIAANNWGTGGSITQSNYNIDNWQNPAIGLNSAIYLPATAASIALSVASNVQPIGGVMELHYSANSCLGNPTLP
jgi:hypothetical protein